MIGYCASLVCAVITFGMAVLQLSLTWGAPFGEYVLGGMHKILPPRMRWLSAAFTVVFFWVVVAYLQRGHIWNAGLNPTLVSGIIIGNTLFLAFAIVGNGFLTKSKKERYVMTPLSIVQFFLSVLAFVLTYGR